MLHRWLFFIILSVFLIGCSLFPINSPPPPLLLAPKNSLAPFNQIKIDGVVMNKPCNIKLHTGSSKSQVNIQGDLRDIEQMAMFVKNDILFVTFRPSFPKFAPVNLDIYTRQLNSVIYEGKGNIYGHAINSNSLDLFLSNIGQTKLDGHINLKHLEVNQPSQVTISGVNSSNLQVIMKNNPSIQLSGNMRVSTINGDGKLNIHWLNSDHLTIRAHGNSLIQLAGMALKLDLELWDQSFFNGRYLQTYDLFAKTHGKSVAEVNARGKQHTLATDASDIFFFHLPDMRADLMAMDGAVLDMRDWNKYLLQPYNRYNKYYTSNS